MKIDEFRVVQYGQKWYAEKYKSPGIWKILGEYSEKEQAEAITKNYESLYAVSGNDKK